jgi:hypothetical protein
MKKLILAAAIAAACAAAAPAFAESNISGGATYFDLGSGYNLWTATGRYGWTSGPVGIEGEAHVGIKDNGGVKVDNAFAVFGTAQANLSDSFEVFARAGYVTISASGFGSSASDSGAAYGVGAIWFFNDANGARLDYTNLDQTDTWGLSWVHKFK